jgi:hypothetical protein
MFAQPSTDAFKPTTRPPETADPDAGGLVGGDGGLVGGDGGLVGISGDAGEGAGEGVGEAGAEGVDAGRPAGDCAAGAGFPA